ncbi:hypothetical protein [Mediterraneibacter gnavus]|uniref:hypothetical protein n=1 Tax=Mediterraneibacter gnavus TaxID=33038 RepID=UPI0032B706AA
MVSPRDMVSSTELTPSTREQLRKLETIGDEYGLYTSIVDFRNPDSVLGSGIYVVASVYPIPENVNPYDLVRRRERAQQLFYVDSFAVKISSKNVMVAFDQLVEYCAKAELLKDLYEEYKTPLPECLRNTEVRGLQNWCDGRYSSKFDYKFQQDCQKGLRTFFKLEKTQAEKRKFFRSTKYDEQAYNEGKISGFFQKNKDFEKRDDPVVNLSLLMESNGDINTLEISEYLYPKFHHYIKNCFPDVEFAVGDVNVVDYGLVDLAKKLPEDHPIMECRPVTSAEYEETIRRDFATEGWRCIENMMPAKWESRKIYYKNVDEPEIITAFNNLYLEFARAKSFDEIARRGEMSMVDISIDDFHRFAAWAQDYDLKYHIDHRGQIAAPSFTDIHVVYSKKDEDKMSEVLRSLFQNRMETSHLFQKETLEDQVLAVEKTLDKYGIDRDEFWQGYRPGGNK